MDNSPNGDTMGKTAEWYRSYRANRQNTPHGTDNGYVNYGCRCGQCKAAHRVRRQQDRSK